MSEEIVHKLKKALIVSVIVVAVISVLMVIILIFSSVSTRQSTRNSSSLSMPSSYLGRGSTFIQEDSITGKASVTTASPMATEVVSPAGMVNQNATESPIIERKLMQDGSLALVVKRVEDAVQSLTNMAQNLGGRADDVQYSNAQDNDKKRATITLRVPAVNFDMAMVQAKGVAIKVESEYISTRDVTEQFIDMQARLKNLKAEEEQYQEIMKKAVKVSDVLEVSQYLFNTRQQIEQIQGQMNYLSRQVDMSVITIQLSSEPDIDATNVIWNPATTVKEAVQYFIKAFYRLADTIIWGILSFLPLTILLGGLLFLFAWLFVKVLRPWYGNIRDFFRS
jgi:hypothetical protein